MWKRNSNISDSPTPLKLCGVKKVFVGLSGGVDSAVSAALLKSQGFDVTGVFIKAWQPDFISCTWRDERRDAMKVCLALDIPFLFFDFEKEYKKGVVDKMLSEYEAGRTPNPDILCNREIKFGIFWQKAKEMGADYIATGHYAQIENSRNEMLSPAHGQKGKFATDSISLRLTESKDKEKDQSYFLWTLTQEDLWHTLFPVGHLEKSEVRKLAQRFKLPIADKKDSQGICFIGNISMDEFLSHLMVIKPGEVLDTKGAVIGVHNGAVLYTMGERHGFEVDKKGVSSGPFYVVAKNMEKNTITVSDKQLEILSLSPKKVLIKDANWITEPAGSELLARIRYRGKKLLVTLSLSGRRLEVEFKEPARGLSLGQSIVFYSLAGALTKEGGNDICYGGAVMDKVLE